MNSWFGNLLGGKATTTAKHINNINLVKLLERLLELDAEDIDDHAELIPILRDLHLIVKYHARVIGDHLQNLVRHFNTQNMEINRIVLEILLALINEEQHKEEGSAAVRTVISGNLSTNTTAITKILHLLPFKDYYIRYHTTQLLKTLIARHCRQMQTSVISIPQGICLLIDLLRDPRESVRNEGLLIITALVVHNEEIQKVVAFEGAFEVLLHVASSESSPPIIHDAILLVFRLLDGSASNQNFFRETSCIPLLVPLLTLSDQDHYLLTDTKFKIIEKTLDVIMLLCSTQNPANHLNQQLIVSTQLSQAILILSLGDITSAKLRSQSLFCLAAVLRNHPNNQVWFATAQFPIGSVHHVQTLPRLTRVLIYAGALLEREAAAAVFEAYLAGNEEGKQALASTLSPNPDEITSLSSNGVDESEFSVGKQLLNALFAWEEANLADEEHDTDDDNENINVTKNSIQLRCWFASSVFQHVLQDSEKVKSFVIRLPLNITTEETFISKFMVALQTVANAKRSPLILIALLKLLILFCFDSPASVQCVLLLSNHSLSFIVDLSLTAFHPLAQGLASLLLGILAVYSEEEEALAVRHIILHRIGFAQYLAKLEHIKKSPFFISAEQLDYNYNSSHSPSVSTPTVTIFSFENVAFLKDVMSIVQWTLSGRDTRIHTSLRFLKQAKKTEEAKKNEEKILLDHPEPQETETSPPERLLNIIENYKEVIANQEDQIKDLKQTIVEMNLPDFVEENIEEKEDIINIPSKSQLDSTNHHHQINLLTLELKSLSDALSNLQNEHEDLKMKYNLSCQQNEKLLKKNQAVIIMKTENNDIQKKLHTEINSLKKENENLLNENELLKNQHNIHPKKDSDRNDEIQQLREENKELKLQIDNLHFIIRGMEMIVNEK